MGLKDILKGRFYKNYHKDKLGHPALVVEKDVKKNRYKILKFTHSNKKSIKLENNINPNDSKDCYVRKKPIIVKKRTFDSKELKGYRIKGSKDKILISKLKRK